MNELDFVALDVETANSSRGSICSIGLAVVESGQIVSTCSWLCQPPPSVGRFDPFNIALHGIDEDVVANEPPFRERMGEALAVIGDRPVIAHNAGFDIGAIRTACDQDELEWPTLQYGCTLVWSRRELDLISYRLPIVANALHVPLGNHHNAGEDAAACAQILITLAARRESKTVSEFAAAVRAPLGRLTFNSWRGCCVSQSARPGLVIPPDNPDADPAHQLYGQVMVFTGALAMRRQDAWTIVAQLGAKPDKGVTKRTTCLVVGDGFQGKSPGDFHTGKAAKAQKLREAGAEIEVLTEADFESLIADTRTAGTANTAVRRRRIEFQPPKPRSQPEGKWTDYWQWHNESLKVDERACGGEPCRVCNQPIPASAAWIHRDRHVCGVHCNSQLRRQWKRQVDIGTLPDYKDSISFDILP